MVEGLVNLVGQNVLSGHNDFGRSVLPRFGSVDVSDLARVALDHDQRTFLKPVGISLLKLRSSRLSDLKLFKLHFVFISMKNVGK